MALDTRPRTQQLPFMSQDHHHPHFTNPWQTTADHMTAESLQHLKPTIRTTPVSMSSNNPMFAVTSAPLSSSASVVRTAPTSSPYPNPSGLMPNAPFSSAEMSMPGSTAPSPTTSSAFAPFSSAMDIPLHARSYQQDRRLSQPSMGSSLYLGSDLLPKQRQASLTEMPYRTRGGGGGEFDFGSDAMDSAKGMLVMSQQPPTPRSARGDAHSLHSASSSISSTHSFPYYNGGSVDSSATDYSDAAGYPSDSAMRQLARPNGYVGSAATVPNQMMTTFSSKITSSTQKKHKCKVCDKRFTRPSSLQTHTYSHTGEKPFVCEQSGCGRRFSVVSNLRRHKKVHQNKNPSS